MPSKPNRSAGKKARLAGGARPPALESKFQRLRRLVDLGDWAEARPLAAKLAPRLGQDPEFLWRAARIALFGARKAPRALQLAEAALRRDPASANAHATVHAAQTALGDVAEATAAAERWLAACPSSGGACYALALSAPERGVALRPRMEALATAPETGDLDRAALMNALGRGYEREGREHHAFVAFGASKKLLNSPYDFDEPRRFLAASRARFGAVDFDAPGGLDDARMVFVVGLPRSGSTLIESVLAAHPEISAGGETTRLGGALRSVFGDAAEEGRGRFAEIDGICDAAPERLAKAATRYLAEARHAVDRPTAARWVDKTPTDFRYCGAIARLFPNARIVMTEREPRDVMLSCLRAFLPNGMGFTESFERFAHFYAFQQEMTALWRALLGERLMMVSYEALVRDFETEARRLIAHAGLAWDPACARPTLDGVAVTTASAAQVRGAVHADSIGGWRRYEAEFAPLSALLEAVRSRRAAA